MADRNAPGLADIVRKKGKLIPDSILSGWTSAELKFMRTYDRGLVKKKDKIKFKDFLERIEDYLPISEETRQAIIAMEISRRSGTFVEVGNPEAAMWRTGGNTYYMRRPATETEPQKDTLLLVTGGEEVQEVANTIIPTVEKTKRPNVDSLTILLSAFVRIKGGEATALVPVDTFIKRWAPERCEFDPTACQVLARAFNHVMQTAPECMTLADESYSASKDVLIREIRRVLTSISEEFYYYLHTVAVFEFLAPFNKLSKQTKEGVRFSCKVHRKRQGKPVVKPESYALIDNKVFPKKTIDNLKKLGFPCVAIYRGKVSPTISIPPGTTIQTALAAKMRGMATRGSDKSGISFLSSQKDFSGLAVGLTRKLQTAVSMALAVIRRGHGVDIFVDSIGDVSILYSSLMHHAPKAEWALIVDRAYLKQLGTYGARISMKKVYDHAVSYVAGAMGSKKGIKDTTSEAETQRLLREYQSTSSDWYIEDYGDYTLLTTLYGYFPWQQPERQTTEGSPTHSGTTTPLSNSRSFVPKVFPRKKHYVYKFGATDQFVGIVSTLADFAMAGYSVTLKEVEVGRTKRKFSQVELTAEDVKLQCVESESDWYGLVIKENAIREAYWCIAKPTYSPISNVLRIPKTGISIVRNELSDTMEATEMDLYIPEAREDEEERGADDEEEDDLEDGEEEDEEEEEPEEEEKQILHQKGIKKVVEKKGKIKAQPKAETDEDEDDTEGEVEGGVTLDQLTD